VICPPLNLIWCLVVNCSRSLAMNVLALDLELTRHLSVERENEIASNLAFLSATSDDSQKVMAACVEEHPDGKGITIRIASNSEDLSEVTNDFQMLATVLEQAAQRGL
jgi:hypothetical protein